MNQMQQTRGLALAAKAARTADRVLTLLTYFVLSMVIVYASYAMWDNYQILNGARADKSLLKFKPELSASGGGVTFEEILKVNPDVRAWLTLEDTGIDYPVVQGEDNFEYLNKDVFGNFALAGSLFLDNRNSGDFTDRYSLIYGHHMQNGTMFAGISWYEDQSYYDEHPMMYLMTPEAAYRIELFSGYITTMDSSAYMQNFGSVREHKDWLKEVSGRSDFRANLEISAYDRVITLSTCAYRFENARYVLHGKLVKLR